MEHCCSKMDYFSKDNKIREKFNSDDIICYSSIFDEYGIVVHDFGKSFIVIEYCPWCGTRLPESKRDRWFEELESQGIMEPFEEEIPEELNSNKWWKRQGI